MSDLKKRSKFVFIILFIMFITPSLIALWVYKHPEWLKSNLTNRGELIYPVVRVSALDEGDKWNLIYWSGKACKKECIAQLTKLAKVRLALGRRLYSVSNCLLIDADTVSPPKELQQSLKAEDINIKKLSYNDKKIRKWMPKEPRIFIASPAGEMVLSYKTNTVPGDIFKDLKHLLVNSNKSSKEHHDK